MIDATAVHEQVETAKRDASYPFFPVIAELSGTTAVLPDGQSLLLFASCDYLGLSQSRTLKQAAVAAIERFGTNTPGAQMFCGYTAIHEELERALATFAGGDAAILMPSGLHANLAVIGSLAGPGDVVISDRANHVSIFMGCKLAGAASRTFLHNDMERLERLLVETRSARRRLVVVDGLFSTCGDFTPLDVVCDLADRYDATVIVDEAHSMGSCGDNGGGAVEMFGRRGRPPIVVGTMSKAFGSVGGFVVADRPTINLLRHYAPSYTSSRGSPPAVAAASLASVAEVTRDGRELRRALWGNIDRMRSGLARAGVRLGEVASPVIPVLIGTEEQTLRIGRDLMTRGVLTSPMVPPAVPPGGGMLRIGVTARHSAEEIDVATGAIAECVAERGVTVAEGTVR